MAYTTVTLATLRARLQDRYTGDPFWTEGEANDALNEALRYFNLLTGYWRGTTTATTTANQPFVSVPAALTYRTRVYRAATKVLTRTSISGLYRTRRNWRTQTTASGSPVPTVISEWAPIGLSKIAIWPADAVGGTTLTLDGVIVTPVLSGDGSFLDLGEEELQLVLAEALYVLGFKRPSILQELAAQHRIFMEGCGERNDQLRASAFYKNILGLDQHPRTEPIRQAQGTEEES